jgi:hypothetical protein
LSEYIIKIKNMKPKRVNKHAKCKFHVKKKWYQILKST